jgi:hypothetical protein
MKQANCEVHHIQPLIGHPPLTTRNGVSYGPGKPSLFPTVGLPVWINSASWNLKSIPKTQHRLVHGDLIELENFWSLYHNPAHTASKAINNEFQN